MNRKTLACSIGMLLVMAVTTAPTKTPEVIEDKYIVAETSLPEIEIIEPVECTPEVIFESPEPERTEEPVLEETEEISQYRYILVSDREYKLMCQVVMAEAGSEAEPQENRIGVAQVILNRLLSGKWGNSIETVVSARNQFTTYPHCTGIAPSQACIDAVDDVLMGRNLVLDYDVLYFSVAQVPYTNYVTTIGGHIYSK